MTASFDDLIRRGASHQPLVPIPTDQAERIGQIGIGVGGGSAAPIAPSTNEQINAKPRLAAREAANRVELGVNLEDVWLAR